jgi:hypothetical protein
MILDDMLWEGDPPPSLLDVMAEDRVHHSRF